jgi:NADPH:quinone reductase-like Zn-dependent oxidoreductase
MKEAIVFPGPEVKIQDVDFPTLPSPNHLIIKVVVSGLNPKDWGIAERGLSRCGFPDCIAVADTNQFLESIKATISLA